MFLSVVLYVFFKKRSGKESRHSKKTHLCPEVQVALWSWDIVVDNCAICRCSAAPQRSIALLSDRSTGAFKFSDGSPFFRKA